jgi:hypothetical protein
MRPSWTCLDDEFFSLIGDGNLEASWGKEDDQPPNESDGSTIKMVRLLHGMAEWPIRAPSLRLYWLVRILSRHVQFEIACFS